MCSTCSFCKLLQLNRDLSMLRLVLISKLSTWAPHPSASSGVLLTCQIYKNTSGTLCRKQLVYCHLRWQLHRFFSLWSFEDFEILRVKPEKMLAYRVAGTRFLWKLTRAASLSFAFWHELELRQFFSLSFEQDGKKYHRTPFDFC